MVVRMDYLNYGKENQSLIPTTSTVGIIANKEPFPHLIVEDFYDEKELELIWEELNFYTKPGKLLEAKDYGGVKDRTNAKALALDLIYLNLENRSSNGINYRNISNILTVNRKLFTSNILNEYAKLHECCNLKYDTDITKIRYYHNGEYYNPHKDYRYQTLIFSYFYKEPKKFSGGELFFPNHNYEYSCNNNSLIIFPAWVEHGVREVKIKDSDYYDGHGRYAITSFLFAPDFIQP